MNRTDWLLLLAGLSLVGFLYQYFWFSGEHGQMVQILSGNEELRLEPLMPDRTLTVKGRLGDSVLEIRDHSIRFLASPCTNKVCIQGGWLHSAGPLLACLPNRISVQILARHARYDAINF